MPSPETGGQAQAQHADQKIEEQEPVPQVNPETAERHEKLTEDVDAILDEIDDVLESNAEDFVRAFVQKGGQ